MPFVHGLGGYRELFEVELVGWNVDDLSVLQEVRSADDVILYCTPHSRSAQQRVALCITPNLCVLYSLRTKTALNHVSFTLLLERRLPVALLIPLPLSFLLHIL